MGKILAIDFGLKRTGLAISDESCTFAFGLETVPSELLMERLRQLVIQENIDTLALGLPKGLDNRDTDITANVRLLAEALAREFPQVQISLVDERMTSGMALRSMHAAGAGKKQKMQKGLVDKVSATIILQSYLLQRG